ATSPAATPLIVTFRPKSLLSTRLSTASWPLTLKPFTSPSRGNRRVRTPSSRESTLAWLSSIHATRRSCLTASRIASQLCLSVSAAGTRTGLGAGRAACGAGSGGSGAGRAGGRGGPGVVPPRGGGGGGGGGGETRGRAPCAEGSEPGTVRH